MIPAPLFEMPPLFLWEPGTGIWLGNFGFRMYDFGFKGKRVRR